MIKKIEDIVKDVRICLDQNMVSESLLNEGDIDTLSIEDIIRSKIVDAVQRVESGAPTHLLEGGHNFGDSIYWTKDGSGWTLLPDDFMRLVVFEMSDWERPVYEAIAPTDAAYALQCSRYKGLRGNVQRPVCAIIIRPEGKALEFYSCNNEEATVSKALYLPYPTIDEDEGIDLSERCYTSIVYMTAALALVTFGDSDKAAIMTEQSKNALI